MSNGYSAQERFIIKCYRVLPPQKQQILARFAYELTDDATMIAFRKRIAKDAAKLGVGELTLAQKFALEKFQNDVIAEDCDRQMLSEA